MDGWAVGDGLILAGLCGIPSEIREVSGPCFTCGTSLSGSCHPSTGLWRVYWALDTCQTPDLFPSEQVTLSLACGTAAACVLLYWLWFGKPHCQLREEVLSSES